jgi:hypothetical protein
VAGLFEAGVKLIELIATEASTNSLEQLLSGLFKRDAITQKPTLPIPLPESLSQERLAKTFSGLLNRFGR